jgi:hypothetical protein
MAAVGSQPKAFVPDQLFSQFLQIHCLLITVQTLISLSSDATSTYSPGYFNIQRKFAVYPFAEQSIRDNMHISLIVRCLSYIISPLICAGTFHKTSARKPPILIGGGIVA